jgi:Na+/H+-dicarboxylate symporter/ABC-type amino acid transport substrate-binding protein
MAEKKKFHFSLGTQVLLAFVLGLAMGMFFGETVGFLKNVGRAFILLLQMTVLPYITLSLITGLGQLTYQQVKELVLKAGAVLVFSWVLAIVVILVMPLAFPVWESASFFSTSLIEQPEKVNYLTLFIPANPFYSFANNIVPAVVLFSIAVGVALIGIEQKQTILDPLRILNRAMARITQFVSKLMPLGVLAIVASAAGTMSLEELGRLQVYLLTYIALALVLTLWVLPALITSFTTLTYRQVIGQTRDILITAFATGSGFIVLPLLIERSKELLRQGGLGTEDTEATVDVIIPAFTSFPKIGTLLPMSFVLFAGWFSGSTVSAAQYPTFVITGLVSFFGSVNVAMPSLMNLMRVPVDLFQLYLAITIVTSRFAVLMSTTNNLVLTLLGSCAVTGHLTPRWGRMLRNAVLTVVFAAAVLVGLRIFFTVALENAYNKDKIIAGMQLLRHSGPAATVYTSPPPIPVGASQQSTLARIQARGAMRVGYMKGRLPYAYFNTAGDLVGFDIDMAYTLARDLGVQLELVPVEFDRMAERLNTGYCDLIMSGVAVTPERARDMAFSIPYTQETLAFIVKDYRRDEFNSREAVRRHEVLRLGVPNVPYYIAKVRHYLPQAKLVLVSSIREFFERLGEELDALVYTAEAGSAWTLLYPSYAVAVPQPDVLAAPIAYAMAHGDLGLVEFINTWLELKKEDRTISSLYDYWILGQNAVPKQPRWSVLRNVLGWVK